MKQGYQPKFFGSIESTSEVVPQFQMLWDNRNPVPGRKQWNTDTACCSLREPPALLSNCKTALQIVALCQQLPCDAEIMFGYESVDTLQHPRQISGVKSVTTNKVSPHRNYDSRRFRTKGSKGEHVHCLKDSLNVIFPKPFINFFFFPWESYSYKCCLIYLEA